MYVCVSLQLWPERNRYFPLQQALPIGAVEPTVIADVGSSLAPQSSGWVFIKESDQQVFEEWVTDEVERRLGSADLVSKGLKFFILYEERGEASDHLEY